MARTARSSSNPFALTASIDLLLGFLLLAIIAAFTALAASTTRSPDPSPPPPPPPPDTAAFVARRVHEALVARYAQVELDLHTASVRLPGMFATGDPALRTKACAQDGADAETGCVAGPKGRWVPAAAFVEDLAAVLKQELPQFQDEAPVSLARHACGVHYARPCPGQLTTVFIEGHADRTPYEKTKDDHSNNRLSLDRAAAVYAAVTRTQPELLTLESGSRLRRQQLVAAAGFGCRRPAFNTVMKNETYAFVIDKGAKLDERCPSKGDRRDAKEEAKNRRVELRFIVSMTPEAAP